MFNSLIPRRLCSSSLLKPNFLGGCDMNWTLPTWVWSFTLPPHPLLQPSLKAHGNGLWLASIIGPPTALISEAISEPPLPSDEPNRLKPAFVAVKRKFLDRQGIPHSV
ncbi:hypothetical protein AVEN_35865-1 [Araneus ventricosus]|uniref:Uncharacterized protein n=1 Tax=Araneus ventricosus TaxID=182803 RepID=A0A4Y2BK62_ARAVE|nr:hypothetical protein AVEN_35865-1 [Araneus ventricosus]